MWPGVAGCAAKMLLGHKCPAVTKVDASLAVARVSALGFVGLTERWRESVVLLHAQMGLGPPAPAEYLDHAGHHARLDASPLAGFVDEADELVYAEARRVFEARLAAYASEVARLERAMLPPGAQLPPAVESQSPGPRGKLGVFCAGGELYGEENKALDKA